MLDQSRFKRYKGSLIKLVSGMLQKEEIKKGITLSSQQRLVVIPFLISPLKHEETEEPCSMEADVDAKTYATK